MTSLPEYRFDPDLLKRHGTTVLDFLKSHFESLAHIPVKPNLQPGELAARFASKAPGRPREFGDLMKELEEKVMPGLTHWQHPRFFAYYPSASSVPAILSELIIAGLGSLGLQWSSNPIGTELECVVMDWIAKMLHAPEDSPFLHTSGQGGGIIQNTAGDALVAVMAAARVRTHIRRGVEERDSVFYQDSSKLVVYMSDQTHFSGPKAVRVAGMRLRMLPAQRLADGNYGVTATQVKQAMDADRAQGLIPCCVQLNLGTTNTCGYDDLGSFAGFAEQEQVWVHVDAAYAGASLILPQFKARSEALQAVATSFNFNGSKWFLSGFDSAFLFVRDRRFLKDVFSASGVYLDSVAKEEIYNPEFKDWAVPLGRRFRALRIWMVIEYFGVEGLQNFLQAAIDQGNWLREQIDKSEDFEQAAVTDLGLVCFRLKQASQAKTADLIRFIQTTECEGGPFLVYPSQLEGAPIVRVALGGANTGMDDVRAFWNECQTWATSHPAKV